MLCTGWVGAEGGTIGKEGSQPGAKERLFLQNLRSVHDEGAELDGERLRIIKAERQAVLRAGCGGERHEGGGAEWGERAKSPGVSWCLRESSCVVDSGSRPRFLESMRCWWRAVRNFSNKSGRSAARLRNRRIETEEFHEKNHGLTYLSFFCPRSAVFFSGYYSPG